MKKITLIVLMCFISLVGYSQLTENFDGTAAPPDATTGIWTLSSGNWLVRDNMTNAPVNWEFNPFIYPANSATQAAYIQRENLTVGTTGEEWLITPQVDLPANRQIRFFTRQTLTGDLGTKYQVRVSSSANPADLSAYTLLTEYTETTLSTLTPTQLDYEEKVINLPFTGARYIAFVKVFTATATAPSGDRWLVDDVRIVEVCNSPVTLGAENITAYGATVTWVSSAATFDIEYGVSGFTPGSGIIVTGLPNNGSGGNPNSYVIPTPPNEPLTPSTAYQFYVTAHCSTGIDSPQTGPFNWTTSPLGSTCAGPIVITDPLPYSDTDDTLQFGNNINFPSQGTTGCGTTGGNYLESNDVVYAYTVPATTTGLLSIQMNPLGAQNTGVFVYNSCASIGTSCIAGVGNSNSSIRNIPALAVTAGQTIYIVISSTFSTASFDYTLIVQNVNCPPPTGLSATGTGPTSANLSWQNPSNAASWEVFVQTAGSPIPATAGDVTTENSGYSVSALTGSGTPLQLGTPYQYWVRADCGNGTFSAWSGPYLFNTTSCTSGCNYTFLLTDSYGDGWNGNTMTITQGGITIDTVGADFQTGFEMSVSIPLCDGPFQVYWNDGGNFASEVGISIINSFNQTIFTKPSFTGEPDSVVYDGVVNCATPECLPPTNLVSSSVTAFTALLEWTSNGPNPLSWNIYAVPVGQAPPTPGSTPYANTTQNPYTITGLIADTEYVYYVSAVCSVGTTSAISPPSQPFLTLPTCPRPVGLSITNATLSSVDFDWAPGGAETSWEYIVLGANSIEPTATDPGWLPAPGHPFTINNLTSGTVYDFYVRAVCTASDKSKPAKVTGFTTVCAPETQCAYTFTLTTLFGNGWDGNTMTVFQNGVPVGLLGPQFTEGNGPVVVSVPLCPGIVFELFWNNVPNVFDNGVGVTITNPAGQVIFTKAAFEGQQPGTSLYTNTAQCAPPTCITPTGLTIANVSLTTMTVIWNDNNSPLATSWDVLVLPANDLPPTPNTTGWETVTGGIPTYTFINLTAGTNYKVYVRSVCSSSDKSFWSVGKPFTTLICSPANVCDYTFTMTDTFGDTWNGNTMNVIQNGSVVGVLTGPTFNDGTNPVTQVISLCNDIPFELYWNEGGFYPAEVGVSISNQSGTVIFTHEEGEGLQGSTLFSGTVNCVPPTCPKPVQLYAIQITQTQATLGWTETGSAAEWEYYITTAGSPAPTPATQPTGTTLNNPFTIDVSSGTSYVFYVRAVCSESDTSNWSLPGTFASLITNDECANAIVVPVNPDQSCAQIASGTIVGATASNAPGACEGNADDDVWFTFVATAPAHNINLTNVQGSTQDLYHAVYQGNNCGELTQVYCSDNNQSFATGLALGQTYYIRVYSFTGVPNQTSTFDICIGTIASPISASTTLYTAEELVRDVLINSTCAAITDITFSTGTTFGSDNGIGYFNKEGSAFPFQNGIVLTSGNADAAPGPNTTTLSGGDFTWGGDADLQNVLTAQGITGTLSNATSLEFNFVPLINSVSFNFLFASEEYGIYQCTFSDAFAFLLTNTETGVTTNLAVLPNTTIPVSVTTIHDSQYNSQCGDANVEYFGNYYGDPDGEPLSAPINFNGTTVPLTAFSQVTPGVQYHIKMVIADFGPFGSDSALDSAVFLQGGSFGIGDINLGSNLLEANGTAVCSGESQVLETSLDPTLYTFSWTKDDVVLPGETGPSLTVTEEGSYTITVEYAGSVCSSFQTVVVEFYDPIIPGTAPDLVICDPSATAEFNLTLNQPAILAPLNANYTVSYFTSEADAINGTVGEIIPNTAYTNISNPQTIYVRAQNNTTGCYGITTFDLVVQDLTPQFTLPSDFEICAGSSSTIAVTPINFDLTEATYSWTFNNAPLSDVGPSITVTEAGLYQVTIIRSGCSATAGVNVTVATAITPTFAPIAPLCQGNTAPELQQISLNNISGTWSPAVINTDVAGVFEYCFTPNADQTCVLPVCVQVTVNAGPIVSVSDVNACNTYQLPVLAVGNYYTASNGVGQVPAGTIYTAGSVTTLYVYAQEGTCSDEESFTINVGATPTFNPIADVCVGGTVVLPITSLEGITGTFNPTFVSTAQAGTFPVTFTPDAGQGCTDPVTFNVTVLALPVVTVADVSACDNYTLPALAVGEYFASPNRVDPIAVGTSYPAGTTVTVYVNALSGTCTTEASFTITVGTTPVVATIQDVVVCADYTLPALTVGNYFTQPNGAGDLLVAGTVLTTSQTVYIYATTGSGSTACSSESSFTVTVSTPSEFNIQGECEGTEFVLSVMEGSSIADGASYQWFDPNGNPIAGATESSVTVSIAGTYSLVVTIDGCSATQTFGANSISCMIQRGISPRGTSGGDGKNDYFDLAGLNVSRLEIFNRYGTKVYSRTNYSREWYGQSDKGEELADGTYFYVIERSGVDSVTGWIYINREK